MSRSGAAFPVDWYFVPDGTPLLNKRLFHSLDWSKPDYGQGQLGEILPRDRRWRDGSIPDYVGVDARPGGAHPIAGLPDWWVLGAPDDTAVGLRYDGARGYTNASGPGIFPTMGAGWSLRFKLTSRTRGELAPSGSGTFSSWYYHNAFPDLTFVYVCFSEARLFRCVGGVWTLGYTSESDPNKFLRCTAWDQVTNVSTWVDSQGAGLDPGDVLTLEPL